MSRTARWRRFRKSHRTWDSPWVPAVGGLLGGLFLALAAAGLRSAAAVPALGGDDAVVVPWAFLFGFLAVGLPTLLIQKSASGALREIRALINIRPLTGSQLLSRNSWAMDAVYAENVLALVDEGHERILELGSGRSTVLIAERLEERGAGHITAVEHLERFAEETRAALRDRGLENRATVVHAPLAPVRVDGRELQWYDTGALGPALPERIDLLLVDGPPASGGPDARWPAVPALSPHLAPDAVILMDDGDRTDETRAALDWHDRLGGEIRYLAGGRGGWLLRKGA